MLNVLCFDCGGMYQVPYETEDLTKQCPKCLTKSLKSEQTRQQSVRCRKRKTSHSKFYEKSNLTSNTSSVTTLCCKSSEPRHP